jgi:hypothetical protein
VYVTTPALGAGPPESALTGSVPRLKRRRCAAVRPETPTDAAPAAVPDTWRTLERHHFDIVNLFALIRHPLENKIDGKRPFDA